MNLTQLRFQGYLNTPSLWKDSLLSIEQFERNEKQIEFPQNKILDTIRLGNYVERLVSYELRQTPELEILKENVQIIQNKQTLGEIDCLLTQNNSPIHLEIAYKFYLYDSSVGSNFLDHWIGPNRRDSLILKLNKMKEKQFPLLFHEACIELLQELSLDKTKIQQKTLFKAQLFVPYENEPNNFGELNPDAICGFYLSIKQLEGFADCKFYIPRKLDWLIIPHPQVDWLHLERTKIRIEEFFAKQSSPLLWMKQPNGEIKKIFVVWW